MAKENRTTLKHVVRRIGALSNPDAGIFTAVEVEKYLQETYFDAGYELLNMFYMGQSEGAAQFTYIFKIRA